MKYLFTFIFSFYFFALVSRQSAALSSATHHAMPPEFGGKWGTECLNTTFPLPTLLCAGYNVKLILKYFIFLSGNNIYYIISHHKYLLQIKFTTICPYMVDTGLCKKPRIRFESMMKVVDPGEAADMIVNAVRREVVEITIPSDLHYMNRVSIKVFKLNK